MEAIALRFLLLFGWRPSLGLSNRGRLDQFLSSRTGQRHGGDAGDRAAPTEKAGALAGLQLLLKGILLV